MSTQPAINEAYISAALADATANGYDLSGWSAEDIALDLMAYEEGVIMSDLDVEDLVRLVEAWQVDCKLVAALRQ